MEKQMKPLVLPQINLNGSPKERLVEQQSDVAVLFRELLKAMSEAFPNGRDYQLRPAEYAGAREAWEERMLAVSTMCREIEAHALAIQDS
jgi:hypothetical protein